jgi:hypothetical protein
METKAVIKKFGRITEDENGKLTFSNFVVDMHGEKDGGKQLLILCINRLKDDLDEYDRRAQRRVD